MLTLENQADLISRSSVHSVLAGGPVLNEPSGSGFKRLHSADETWSSICLRCMRVLEASAPVAVVDFAERNHVCTAEDLRRAERLAHLAKRDPAK